MATCTKVEECGAPSTRSSKQRAQPDLARAYELISTAPLKDKDGQSLEAKSLWQSRPTIVYIVRRPGCILCRQQAQAIWSSKAEYDALGVDLVAVVHEYIPAEIKEFAELFWPGALYHDESQAFYRALGGGAVLKKGLGWLLNPFSDNWKRILGARKAIEKHNMVGTGDIMGGTAVFRQGDAGIQYLHVEEDFGVHAPPGEVLDAARKAHAAADKTPLDSVVAVPSSAAAAAVAEPGALAPAADAAPSTTTAVAPSASAAAEL